LQRLMGALPAIRGRLCRRGKEANRCGNRLLVLRAHAERVGGRLRHRPLRVRNFPAAGMQQRHQKEGDVVAAERNREINRRLADSVGGVEVSAARKRIARGTDVTPIDRVKQLVIG
jgi:hypothetical protein